jgi:uncharacterized membrane protein
MGSIPACVVGALLGFGAGIFVITAGFWKFLFLLALTLGGFVIGKMIDENSPIIVSLKKLFTGKNSSDDSDGFPDD